MLKVTTYIFSLQSVNKLRNEIYKIMEDNVKPCFVFLLDNFEHRLWNFVYCCMDADSLGEAKTCKVALRQLAMWCELSMLDCELNLLIVTLLVWMLQTGRCWGKEETGGVSEKARWNWTWVWSVCTTNVLLQLYHWYSEIIAYNTEKHALIFYQQFLRLCTTQLWDYLVTDSLCHRHPLLCLYFAKRSICHIFGMGSPENKCWQTKTSTDL